MKAIAPFVAITAIFGHSARVEAFAVVKPAIKSLRPFKGIEEPSVILWSSPQADLPPPPEPLLPVCPIPKPPRQGLPTNALAIGTLATAAAYGVLHHDIEKLVALPESANHAKVALTMFHDLPTEWLAWYDNEALSFPLMTKATTSGVCYFIGDLCAQALSGKDIETLKLDRAVRSGAAGFVGHGPIAHYWLQFLDQYLSFDGAWWSVVPKIVIDQGPMSIVYNTIYSLLLGAFAFRDPREVVRDVRAAFVPGFLASIRFWPLVHLVTFTAVPIELQLLWIDICEIVWVCILSRVNNEGIHGDISNAEVDDRLGN